MIDYFALLDQPRAPWVDPDKLKDTFHRKTLENHPDSQAGRSDARPMESAFANLNEAYQVLRDPKRRLHHLLSLEGCAPSSDQTIPEKLHDLFPAIGALSQRTKLLLDEVGAASNTLSRALLKPRILERQNETNAVRKMIQDVSDASIAELRRINEAWARNPKEQIEPLSHLYFVFAYLGRWSAQLDEMTFQLSVL